MSGSSEHRIPPSQRAQAYFEKGKEAALSDNFDYAIRMYRDALQLVPTNLQYRKELRDAQRGRFDNSPAKVGRLVGARLQPIRMRARSALSKGKNAEALDHCEDAFGHNPWDYHTAQIAAEAAEALQNPALARWLLESVAMQGGDDYKFFRHLAHVYEINQDFERAILCWQKVKQLHPSDDEANRKIKGLSASETIHRAGLDHALRRGPAAEEDDENDGEQQELQAGLNDLKRQAVTPEVRLQQVIEAEPQRVGHYLELADLLRRANRLDEAEKILAQGIRAIPGENLLLEAHADTQISRLRRAQAGWKRKAEEQPDDPSIPAKLQQVTAMLAEYEMKEFRRRSLRYPDDPNIQFQLGLRLQAAEKWDEAIAEFQKSRAAPSLKLQSLYQAGICFESKGLPKLAERNYQEALKLADPSDQDLLNALHYRLGRAAEAHGDLLAAEEHYNEVAANDYTYEDVARRLENLNRRPGS